MSRPSNSTGFETYVKLLSSKPFQNDEGLESAAWDLCEIIYLIITVQTGHLSPIFAIHAKQCLQNTLREKYLGKNRLSPM